MSPRALKIALALSVAVNLFAVAGGVTAWIAQDRAVKQAEAQGRPGREDRLGTLLQPLPQETRERIRADLRASALTARPDFDTTESHRLYIQLLRGVLVIAVQAGTETLVNFGRRCQVTQLQLVTQRAAIFFGKLINIGL